MSFIAKLKILEGNQIIKNKLDWCVDFISKTKVSWESIYDDYQKNGYQGVYYQVYTRMAEVFDYIEKRDGCVMSKRQRQQFVAYKVKVKIDKDNEKIVKEHEEKLKKRGEVANRIHNDYIKSNEEETYDTEIIYVSSVASSVSKYLHNHIKQIDETLLDIVKSRQKALAEDQRIYLDTVETCRVVLKAEKANMEAISKQIQFLIGKREEIQEYTMDDFINAEESENTKSQIYKINNLISDLSKKLRYHTESYCKIQGRYLSFQNRITETRANFADEYNKWLINGESMLKQYTMALELDVSLSDTGYQEHKVREEDEGLQRATNAVMEHDEALSEFMNSNTTPYVTDVNVIKEEKKL